MRVQTHAANQTPDFQSRGSGDAGVNVARPVQNFFEQLRDALGFFSGGCLLGTGCGFRGGGVAYDLVEAHRDGLAEVHGAVLFARWNAHEPMAMAHFVVRESEFLGSEEERDGRGSQLLSNDAAAHFQAAQRMVEGAMAFRGSTDD